MNQINLKDLEDKWLGDKQVKVALAGDPGRPGDSDGVIVHYNDGASDEWSARMLAADGVVTNNPQDPTEFREKQVIAMVRDLLQIVRDYNPREKDLNYTIQKFEASLAENIRAAQRVLWGVENEGEERIRLVDKVLTDAKDGKTTLKDVIPGA